MSNGNGRDPFATTAPPSARGGVTSGDRTIMIGAFGVGVLAVLAYEAKKRGWLTAPGGNWTPPWMPGGSPKSAPAAPSAPSSPYYPPAAPAAPPPDAPVPPDQWSSSRGDMPPSAQTAAEMAQTYGEQGGSAFSHN